MAQEDKGLVARGLFLLALIGVLVAFVLTILFWRNELPATAEQTPPEPYIALGVATNPAPFPSSVNWAALPLLSHTLPSEPGFQIRYNAAATLARRGSPKTPWPLLREMLDEKLQMRNARVRQADGKNVYDEDAAHATMIVALRAIAAWHEQHKADAKSEIPLALRDVRAIVDQLAENSQGEVKKLAEEAARHWQRVQKKKEAP